MALAGINGVEKFIHMILGVELEMRISEEEREDDVYYRNLRERLSSLEILRSHRITYRRLPEFEKFLLHKLLVGPWQATLPDAHVSTGTGPCYTVHTFPHLIVPVPSFSTHTHTHTHTRARARTHTKGYKMQVISHIYICAHT